MQLSWLNRTAVPIEPDPQSLMSDYIQTDNPACLAQLIHKYGDDLYHFLLRQTDAATAADLAQHSWLKVIEHKQQFQASSSFKTWLFAIGRNLLLDEFRKQKRWVYESAEQVFEQEPEQSSLHNPGPAELLEQQQSQHQLQYLLEQLPLLQREALLLQLEGFSLIQIAEISSASIETVKSRLRYARHHLTRLTGEHYE